MVDVRFQIYVPTAKRPGFLDISFEPNANIASCVLGPFAKCELDTPYARKKLYRKCSKMPVFANALGHIQYSQNNSMALPCGNQRFGPCINPGPLKYDSTFRPYASTLIADAATALTLLSVTSPLGKRACATRPSFYKGSGLGRNP